MNIKPGVDVKGIKPEIVIAMMVANDAYRQYGINLTITAALDGKHMENSKHYEGLAIDLRTRNVPPEILPVVLDTIRRNLGRQYDVAMESDHIHIEFDPK